MEVAHLQHLFWDTSGLRNRFGVNTYKKCEKFKYYTVFLADMANEWYCDGVKRICVSNSCLLKSYLNYYNAVRTQKIRSMMEKVFKKWKNTNLDSC